MLLKLLVGSVPVIGTLVGAAFVVPSSLPLLLRQVLLCITGVGGTMVAERCLFGSRWRRILTTLGFVAPRARAAAVAIVVSLPMWLFLPLYGRLADAPFALTREWLPILLAVILVNGLAEEVIHRAFIFGGLVRHPKASARAVRNRSSHSRTFCGGSENRCMPKARS